MCGLCGFFSVSGAPADRSAVERMTAALVHRGPDDEGFHFDGPAGLGFRRLSILDLERGHQPMLSDDGRLAVVFNGEVYNHLELRRLLPGAAFKTHSDTETILRLYEKEGPDAFKRLVGMFAVAVWDSRKNELTLARDPLGIKPLYYSFDGKRLLFASELRALIAGGVSRALYHAAVIDYLSYGKVHAPRTILRDALKLPPGSLLRLSPSGLKVERYWKLPRRAPLKIGLREAEDVLDRVLSEAVKGAMLSDVPVGAFLSGGVDSSLIAAYMVRHAGKERVQTFSVGFSGADSGVDESAWAKKVAAHLGTEHHALTLPATVLEKLEDSIGLLDEPIADSAILPTYLLAKHARERVKVVLTGEGADELFAGYNRYKAAWVNENLKRLPSPLRGLAAPLARRLGKGQVFDSLPMAGARDWAEATASARPDDLRAILRPEFWEAASALDPLEWLKDLEPPMERLNDALAFDLQTVLCDSLLMKADKSTMRASLEARVPFLNAPVVEHSAELPASLKIRYFKGKYLLRKVAARYLPSDVVWRKKHGFIVPWEAWVRDPKNAAAERLLSARSEIFDQSRLRLFRDQLARGSRDVEAGLFFRALVLGLWLESIETPATAR